MPSVPAGAGTAAAQSAFAVAVFDELVRGGVRDVVVCPGSRSTPLVLAALRTDRLTVHVRLDERSAGFFAIGVALRTGAPVGVVVTSGTAAAELTAAVVEADLAGVPIVVITADRPPELRGVGAPQTIDQVKLYGGAVRRFEDPGPIRVGTELTWRPLASRLLDAATGEVPGPVHLNVALVEPLDAAASEVPAARGDGAPWRRRHRTESTSPGPVALFEGRRVLVVAGRGAPDRTAVLELAAAHGWPVLADPLSGTRVEHPCVVAAFDPLLRDEALRDALRPDVVVQLGAMPASKVLAEAIGAWRSDLVAVGHAAVRSDPSGFATDALLVDARSWAASMSSLRPLGAPGGYLEAWRRADAAAQQVLDDALCDEVSEPAIARLLSQIVPAGTSLVVSSSMPVRDLEWFGAKVASPPAVYANRGANGIDGVVSTALGVAAGHSAVGLLGDLAFLHDVGSLADGLGDAGGSCVLVVVDNRGGGIFSFLPQRGSVPTAVFERLFATPPRVEVASVAAGFGVDVSIVKDLAAVRAAVHAGLAADGVSVVVCTVPDRDANVELHRALGDQVATAAAPTG